MTTNLLVAQDIRINEVLASNKTNLADEDGEYSDWIEVYNSSATAANLKDWTLTNDKDNLQKWKFPDVTIGASAYLIVFLSDKNRKTDELHTNFKLKADGGYLALSNPDNVKISEFDFSYTYQLADESYGYYNGNYYIFTQPTPGVANNTSQNYHLPSPKFSHSHGFYESLFGLELSAEHPDARIYYTKGGSWPTPENWHRYIDPINVSSTTIIRAIAVINENVKSRVSTQSYLYLDKIIKQSNKPSGYPAYWGAHTKSGTLTPADYEVDPALVMNTGFAEDLKVALQDIPTISVSTDIGNLFSHNKDSVTGGIYIHTGPPVNVSDHGYGFGWERPVSFEYIDSKDTATSFQVNCGIKMHGGFSRKPEILPKHALRLVFKEKYGTTKLRKSIYGEEGAPRINSIILRAGFGDSWVSRGADRGGAQYQRDIWAKDTQIDMGYQAGHSKYAHLYLNGLYWGLYVVTEKLDEHFAESYLDGDIEDFDVIKDFSELMSGDTIAWNEMLALAKSGLSTDENYHRMRGNNPDGSPNPGLDSYLDFINLIDYILINFYGGARDWDHHNWVAIRNRLNPGTGFKFFCWDSEYILEELDRNATWTNNYGCPTYFFHKLMSNDNFKRLFADRVQKHFYNDGALTQRANTIRWLERSKEVDKAIVGESARWGDFRRDVRVEGTGSGVDLYTREAFWIPGRNKVVSEFFPNRGEILIEQLRNKNYFPQLDAPEFLINDVKIHSNIRTKGEELTMRATKGMVYYTSDGSDPVDWTKTNNFTNLIEKNADKKVVVPTTDIGNNWYLQSDFNDAAWLNCVGNPGGVGYEINSSYNELISLDVSDYMYNGANPNTSCYIRIPFDLSFERKAAITRLFLSIRYDDGFVAYLNGQKVASINAPEPILWNSTSITGIESESPEEINLSAYINTLKVGTNILAIHAVNYTTTSSDFLFTTELLASDESSVFLTPVAQVYSSEISIEDSAHFTARTFYKGEWSALTERQFVIQNDYKNLRITEIHYHPLGENNVEGTEFEFIELKNIGQSTINLSGVHFVRGISYTFPNGSSILPGEFVTLASNSLYFKQRYNFDAFGEFEGQISNGGETITVLGKLNDTIIDFTYSDRDGWPLSADGEGFSLVPIDEDPKTSSDNHANWRASGYKGGSPGKNDSTGFNPSLIAESPSEKDHFSIRNYPNPFSESTSVSYNLPIDGYINISIYNLIGEKVTTLVNQYQPEGRHQIEWSGTDKLNSAVDAGLYLCRIEISTASTKQVSTLKMVVLR